MMTRLSHVAGWRERGSHMVATDTPAELLPSCATDPADDCFIVPVPSVRLSVYEDSEAEALRFKWIESEKAGYDLGENALRWWVRQHWHGYLRARWIEHLEGKRYWMELDNGDYGLLQRAFHDQAVLLDRILDRLKVGHENLHILLWADQWNIPEEPVLQILEALDINSRRLAHRFDPWAC